MPAGCEAHQDEFDHASTLRVSTSMASNLAGPRCINGQLARQTRLSIYRMSRQYGLCSRRSAIRSGLVHRHVLFHLDEFPPPPPPPVPMQQGTATSNAVTCPREWTPIHTKPKAWNTWQSCLGSVCGKSLGIDKIALSCWIMSFSSLKDTDASRSHFRGTVGAMHGVRLIMAPHIVVLAQSANAQSG